MNLSLSACLMSRTYNTEDNIKTDDTKTSLTFIV